MKPTAYKRQDTSPSSKKNDIKDRIYLIGYMT